MTAAVGAPGLGPAQLLALQRSIGNARSGGCSSAQVRVDGGKEAGRRGLLQDRAGKSVGSRARSRR